VTADRSSVAQTRKLVQLTHRVDRLADAVCNRLLEPIGLSNSQGKILAALHEAGERLTVSTVARLRGLKRQSVQRSADLLERAGLVEYVENPSDARAYLVKLTTKGRRTVRRLRRVSTQHTKNLSEGVSLRRLEIASRVLETLSARLDQEVGRLEREAAKRSR
jgi:DNA-binding MarR family transcriptional regulator